MKMSKIIAVLLAFVMTVGTVSAFATDTFSDVSEDAYYAEAVEWAAEQGIAEGRGDGVFDPDATVTRAEAVTFLWRMAGKPEPTQSETFADVEADAANAPYIDAIRWAAEHGITNGTGHGNFSPALPCTRGMILTMIYRMEGNPYDAAVAAEIPENSEDWTLEDLGNALVQSFVEGLRGENGFTDVPVGAYYELPIHWAVINALLGENQIDTEAMTVKPDAACLRGEMVYFLYCTAEYEKAAQAAAEANQPAEPIEVGTVEETVLLERDDVKITLTGIRTDDYGDPELCLTMENGTEETLNADVGELYVNTYAVSSGAYIPVKEENYTFYDSATVPAGETRDFFIGLSGIRDCGLAAVREIELSMNAFTVTEQEDYTEYEEFAFGEPVLIRTDLYDESVSYDLEGTVIYEGDGLKVLVCKAENSEYGGPQISIFAYNSGSEDAELELAELKLDGESVEAYFGMTVAAGKRRVESISIDYGEAEPTPAAAAEITLRTMDTENWEPLETFAPVTVALAG